MPHYCRISSSSRRQNVKHPIFTHFCCTSVRFGSNPIATNSVAPIANPPKARVRRLRRTLAAESFPVSNFSVIAAMSLATGAASNFPAWLLAWSVAVQDREGWAPFVSLQPQYSLVERSAELELLPTPVPGGRSRRPAVGTTRP